MHFRRARSYHAGRAPNIRRRAITATDEHLKAAVLARLNVVRVMMIGPAGITEIGNLHLKSKKMLIVCILLKHCLIMTKEKKSLIDTFSRRLLFKKVKKLS